MSAEMRLAARQKNRESRRPVFPLLLFCLLLGGVVYLQLREEAHNSPVAPAGGTFSDAEPVAHLDLRLGFNPPSPESYAEIAARPLFSSSRRPPQPVEPSAPVEERADPLVVILTGVIISPVGRFAIVQQGTSANPFQVNEGQEFHGWTVQSIAADRISLRRRGIVEEVRFDDKSPARGKASPQEARVDDKAPARSSRSSARTGTAGATDNRVSKQ